MNFQVTFARVLHTSEPSSVLQHVVAVCCSVLKRGTMCCSVTFARVLHRIKPICHKDLRLPFERVTGPQMSPTYSQKSHTYSWANKGLRTPTRVPSLYKTIGVIHFNSSYNTTCDPRLLLHRIVAPPNITRSCSNITRSCSIRCGCSQPECNGVETQTRSWD